YFNHYRNPSFYHNGSTVLVLVTKRRISPWIPKRLFKNENGRQAVDWTSNCCRNWVIANSSKCKDKLYVYGCKYINNTCIRPFSILSLYFYTTGTVSAFILQVPF